MPIANEDGAITTDWQEGRALEWQLPAKNPHPNRYHIVFKEGAFKEEHLAIFMSSDPRIKSIIQKENAKFAEVSRGAKRSRDDSKASSSKEDEEGDDAAEEKKDKPVKKKAKISETASPVPTSTKPVKEEKKKPKKNEMQVDEKPKTEESTTKAAPTKTEKKPVAKKADAAKTEEKSKNAAAVKKTPLKSPKKQ